MVSLRKMYLTIADRWFDIWKYLEIMSKWTNQLSYDHLLGLATWYCHLILLQCYVCLFVSILHLWLQIFTVSMFAMHTFSMLATKHRNIQTTSDSLNLWTKWAANFDNLIQAGYGVRSIDNDMYNMLSLYCFVLYFRVC